MAFRNPELLDTKKLGFGLMRLPKLDDGSIDIEQVKVMVDKFLEAGFTYFDTAYVYEAGESEKAAKVALFDRHPRESFTFATKLNASAAKDAEDAKAQFETSMERTGAGYFDFYLLHNINGKNADRYEEWGLWEFMRELKASGKIKNLGFSFHGTPDLLRKTLTEHPEVDFCQLQVNYADMNEPAVCSAENVAICNEFGVPFTIMEPVKGGTLANPPKAVAAVFDEANPNVSYPSWAIRFAASQPGVLTVLSGMSNIEQMEDNIATMKDFEPMGAEDMAVMDKARSIIEGIDSIKCTACEYCTPGCPMSIPIPEYFKAMNSILIYDDRAAGEKRFARVSSAEGAGLPSSCIMCGQCEAACPQSLTIIQYLQDVAAAFE